MNKYKEERRAYARSEIILKVDYPGREAFLHDYTENISKGGTFIATSRKWNKEDKIHLILSFPGLLKPIVLKAEVRWTEEKGIGVRFIFDSEEEKEKLHQLITAIQREDRDVIAPKYKILIVEDNEIIRRLLCEGLSSIASRELEDSIVFSFVESENGYEAFKRLETEQFDLVIIDIFLPVLDGIKLIYKLRERFPKERLPILVVSSGDVDTKKDSLKAGADFFIGKPLRLINVFNTIRSLLRI
jgi:two-component system chemotaxis response regulator CheY